MPEETFIKGNYNTVRTLRNRIAQRIARRVVITDEMVEAANELERAQNRMAKLLSDAAGKALGDYPE